MAEQLCLSAKYRILGTTSCPWSTKQSDALNNLLGAPSTETDSMAYYKDSDTCFTWCDKGDDEACKEAKAFPTHIFDDKVTAGFVEGDELILRCSLEPPVGGTSNTFCYKCVNNADFAAVSAGDSATDYVYCAQADGQSTAEELMIDMLEGDGLAIPSDTDGGFDSLGCSYQKNTSCKNGDGDIYTACKADGARFCIDKFKPSTTTDSAGDNPTNGCKPTSYPDLYNSGYTP